jgi:hypothetical protein
MSNEVSFGEPIFFHPDESDISPARIRRFSQSVLSAEAWFRSADELIAAMDLLEPNVVRFWEDVRSIAFAADTTSDVRLKPQKTDAPSKHEKSDAPPEHGLMDQHMMLAGFAIENICKGYLAARLSDEERQRVHQAGVLPKSFRGHHVLKLVEQTGMTLSDTEKFLLKRITDAVLWRGRYPSAISHEAIRPFAQIGSDIRHIKGILQRLRRHVRANDPKR